jgi:hypothetical protein
MTIFALANLFSLKVNKQNENKTSAISISENYSIFINSPTYSVTFNDKLYFIDNFDKLLKVYDLNENKFLTSVLSLQDYDNIVDATFNNGNLFILGEKDSSSVVLIVDLENMTSKTITDEKLNASYSKISSTIVGSESEKNYAISLTPEEITADITPLVLLVSCETHELSQICNINFDASEFADIKSNLFKFFVLNSTSSENKVNIVFFYESRVAYSQLTLDSLKNNEIITAVTLISSTQLENSSADVSERNINMMTIEENSYFLITYLKTQDENVSSYSKLYKYNFDDGTTTGLSYVYDLESANNDYILTSENQVIYPTESQTIKIVKISIDESQRFMRVTSSVSNPSITVSYYGEDDFKYLKTTQSTPLYASPWDLTPILVVENEQDLICIGYGYIGDENSVIQDFKYCLYTFEGVNYKGYANAQNLAEKETISLEDYDYKIFKVVPNTNLYSLPTKVVGDKITNQLTSEIKLQIKDNSRVEVIDVICAYTTQKSTMLKVKVNDSEIGYIERSSIINPSEKVDFVITNSSIKNDNTKVYLESNSESSVIYTLNEGYRIRINGTRNTKSGFTSITFNDEYGNEWTGYIATDIIAADSWSTLQIVGSILIAINIGLLILIIKFRNDFIGKNGQKYDSNKVTNYSKSNGSDHANNEEN